MKTLLLALAMATAAAGAASAQWSAGGGNNEVVTVTAPHPQQHRRSTIGAPIVNVALSREVRFDDLDLRTYRGAHVLRERVRRTAVALCRDIDDRYLVTQDDDRSCVRDAEYEAMDQAEEAIADAQS